MRKYKEIVWLRYIEAFELLRILDIINKMAESWEENIMKFNVHDGLIKKIKKQNYDGEKM